MTSFVSVVAGKPSVATGDPGIMWAPISSPMRLQFSGTSCSETGTALVEAFGDFPIRLIAADHLPVLKGMCAAAGPGKQPYQQHITALAQFTTLELTQVV